MSGPASGVMAAAYTGRVSGQPNLITYDMGGTSTDVGLIEDAVPQVSGELELEYAMPIHVPMVDVHTIGAGGGSIASVDAAGMLRVGPESAGARPGPICYGRGGTEPTITDANLILGRLNPDRLLGVDHPVTLDHVRAMIEQKVGKPLGLDADRGRRRHPAHRQRPHGRRDAGSSRCRAARSAGLRAVRLRRRRAVARHGAGARAGDPDRDGAGASRHHQRAGLRRRRPAPRLRAHGQQAALVGDRCRCRAHLRRAEGGGEATIRREGVPVRELRASTAPTCSSRARATSCRWRSSGPTSASPACTRPSPPPTGGASASSSRRSRRCWSTCTPR
jgi:N-methylhydantoinase A